MKRALTVGLALYVSLFVFASPVVRADLVCSSTVMNACGGGGGGATVIASGTTTITGGTDTHVCYNDAGTMRCGDAGFTYSEGTDTPTILGGLELGHASANTLSAASGILSVEGKALLDVSSSQTITAGTKDFEGGTLTVSSTGSGTPAYLAVPALTLLTGADNICIGAASCAAATTSNQNVVIGSNAGDGATTTMTVNVLIGYNAGTGSSIGTQNTAVGATALDATNATSTQRNSAFGYSSLGGVTGGSRNTGIGYQSGNSVTSGNDNIFIGDDADTTAGTSGTQICIGSGARCTAANQMVIGGNGSQITDIYISEGVTNATPLDTTIQGTGGNGTDIAGADLRIAGGKGTGTGAGGDLVGLTSPALTTGTTLQTLEVRSRVVAKQFALTDNTVATFAVQTLGNDTGGGGSIEYCVYAADATTAGVECGRADFAGVDVTAGAGGEVCPNLTKVGTPLQALSGSTLTVTFTATTGTDLCNLRVTADTDIVTPVELWIKYSVVNSGRVITPQ